MLERTEHLRAALRTRLRAAAVHFSCCIVIAALVLALVFLGWYPPPLDRISGLEIILTIMLGADVVLGPLMTLIIYNPAKKYLKFDIGVVVFVQVAALLYGVYTVYQGRPAYMVFVKDRFEVVAPADLKPGNREKASGNRAAAVDPLRPVWVAARTPTDVQERQKILFDSLQSGTDVQHLPQLYEPYAAQAREAAGRAAPLEQLGLLNAGKASEIDALPATLGVAADQLRFLPLKGPERDGAVIVHAETGEVLRVLALRPWK